MYAPLTHFVQLEKAHVLADEERARLKLKHSRGGGGPKGSEDLVVKHLFPEIGTIECRGARGFVFITQVFPQSTRANGRDDKFVYYWTKD
jgi:hypothetical protein